MNQNGVGFGSPCWVPSGPRDRGTRGLYTHRMSGPLAGSAAVAEGGRGVFEAPPTALPGPRGAGLQQVDQPDAPARQGDPVGTAESPGGGFWAGCPSD